jgi:hypothetical protein
MPIVRTISMLGMAGGFLAISPSLRGSALNALGQATFVLDKYSPYSYIGLAIVLGTAAIMSLSNPKPQ